MFVKALVPAIAAVAFALSIPAAAQDASKLSKSELQALLVGHSVPLGASSMRKAKGAIYFSSTTKAEVLWKGKEEAGTWRAGGDSAFCYTFSIFGGEECVQFMKDSSTGGYLWVFNGQTRTLGPDALQSGKSF